MTTSLRPAAPTVDRSAGPVPRATRHDWWDVVPYAWAMLLSVAYATISLSHYERYVTRSWDSAIFTQIVRAYAHLHAPVVDLKGPGFNALGDHFSPLLIAFAPLFRLWPTPVTLFVGQALLVAWSVVPLMRVAMRQLGRASGIAVGVAYGLSWGLQSGANSEFHEFALAVPLLALAGAAYLEHRWIAMVVWAGLLLLVKEDLGLTVLVLGLVTAASGARRIGLWLAAAGLAMFVLTTTVIIPAFNPDHVYDYWGRFGASGNGSDPLARVPHLAWALVDPPVKIETLALTLAVSGLIALRSPFVLLAVPNLLERFLGDVPFYWGTDWHYSMPLMPILFIAGIDGIRRARLGRPVWLRAYAAHAPAVMVAVAVVLLQQFPLDQLVQTSTYQPSPRAADASAVLAKIPSGASVESDIGLMTRLAADHSLYWIGSARGVTPRFVLIDDEAGWSPPPSSAARFAESEHTGHRYRMVFDRGGYQLARLVDAGGSGRP